jgi:hypothetical protein
MGNWPTNPDWYYDQGDDNLEDDFDEPQPCSSCDYRNCQCDASHDDR